jgi:hypothetical protein
VGTLPIARKRLARPVLILCTVATWGSARATVQEPNGINVPAPPIQNGCANVTCPTGRVCSDGRCETPLQSYFDAQGETIDAHADAAVEPGAFLPLCDFQATLVLSESQATAGIAWYNQPAAPTGPPPTFYPIGPASLTVGQTIASTDIRTSANYAGGLIGFALLKQLNNQPTPVYYSEYQRNVLCSGCTTPGYWKMALAYQSKQSNTYYVAFEDWEGADQSSWQGNDGDFNDKVFQISGVTCNGGGDFCMTGKSGVCAAGVSQCQVGGTIACKQQVPASAEKCDNLDNDCNGVVDDGPGLCPAGRRCVQGVCVPPCGLEEFDCLNPFVCMNGLCVEAACVGKTCATGQVCRAGNCVGGCQGVVCPLGQTCQLGACVDPCAGISCPGAVCEKGACVTGCGCRVCPTGQTCAQDGHCVDRGCDTMTCGAGQVCRAGACVDACQGAVCPGGGPCRNGICEPPPMTTTTSGGAGTAGSTSGAAGATGAAGGRGGANPAGSTGAGGSAAPDGGAAGTTGGPKARGTVACGCAAAATEPGALRSAFGDTFAAFAFALAGVIAARCRRRPRGSD